MKFDSKKLKTIVLVGLTGMVVYVLAQRTGTVQNNVSQRDSLSYWAGSRLLLHHESPYDPAKVGELEQIQGYNRKPLVVRTPPWSLFMILPLAVLDPFWAWALWSAASLASLVTAMRICWKIYGEEGGQSIFSLVGYTFAPVPACLAAGQMGLLLLLGLILFLKLLARRPFLAGAALILPFAKPHLLLPFWITLLLWVLRKKNYAVACGLIAAFVSAMAIAFAFDANILRQYREFIAQAAIGHEFIPALSGVIRALFFHRMFWVQFVPLVSASVWCVWYFARHGENWDWREHGMTVMVVSILVTPYSWLSDEVVLLPAVLQAAMWVYRSRQRITLGPRVAILLFVCLNFLLLLILSFKIPFSGGIYFWSSLVWFAWYFYARRLGKLRAPDLISVEAKRPTLAGATHSGC